MDGFRDALRTQRWDDHRYYHHSRINQSLHFISALSFLFAYVWLFVDPMISALVTADPDGNGPDGDMRSFGEHQKHLMAHWGDRLLHIGVMGMDGMDAPTWASSARRRLRAKPTSQILLPSCARW